MQRSLGGDPNLRQDDFFARRKEAFLEKMTEHGLDLMQVKDFLDDRCVHEENQELVLEQLNNPLYVNALKNGFMQPANARAALAGGYSYVPNLADQ